MPKKSKLKGRVPAEEIAKMFRQWVNNASFLSCLYPEDTQFDEVMQAMCAVLDVIQEAHADRTPMTMFAAIQHGLPNFEDDDDAYGDID